MIKIIERFLKGDVEKLYLYQINGNKLEEIKEESFKKEAELHQLCEANLEEIFGLQFVRREFTVKQFRIDTLAFDSSTNSFVIIEYKNTRNFSVIDQGYAYLSLMLNHKADFILEYNECCQDVLRKDSVEWSQSRVIFVSPVFNNYQKESINFKDLPIELWEVKKFNNGTIYFNPVKGMQPNESIKKLSTVDETVQQVNQEVKTYSESDHLKNRPSEIIELYERIKEYVCALDDSILIKPKKQVIGFHIKNKVFIDTLILKKSLKVWLNLKNGELQDYKGITKDVSNIGHWGNGDYEIQIKDSENLDYILSLIKETYRLKK